VCATCQYIRQRDIRVQNLLEQTVGYKAIIRIEMAFRTLVRVRHIDAYLPIHTVLASREFINEVRVHLSVSDVRKRNVQILPFEWPSCCIWDLDEQETFCSGQTSTLSNSESTGHHRLQNSLNLQECNLPGVPSSSTLPMRNPPNNGISSVAFPNLFLPALER
jgi:hypothetical protein